MDLLTEGPQLAEALDRVLGVEQLDVLELVHVEAFGIRSCDEQDSHAAGFATRRIELEVQDVLLGTVAQGT